MRSDSFPVRIIFQLVDEDAYPVYMAVMVPKRLIRKATDRNLLKRRIREIYRIHKPRIRIKGHSLQMLIQYRSDETTDHQSIERAYLKAVAKMTGKIENQVNG